MPLPTSARIDTPHRPNPPHTLRLPDGPDGEGGYLLFRMPSGLTVPVMLPPSKLRLLLALNAAWLIDDANDDLTPSIRGWRKWKPLSALVADISEWSNPLARQTVCAYVTFINREVRTAVGLPHGFQFVQTRRGWGYRLKEGVLQVIDSKTD